MLKRIFVLVFAAVLLFSCTDKEMAEQNKILKKNIKQLKQTVKLIKLERQSMKFLSEQMKDVKAKIVTNH